MRIASMRYTYPLERCILWCVVGLLRPSFDLMSTRARRSLCRTARTVPCALARVLACDGEAAVRRHSSMPCWKLVVVLPHRTCITKWPVAIRPAAIHPAGRQSSTGTQVGVIIQTNWGLCEPGRAAVALPRKDCMYEAIGVRFHTCAC